MTEPLYDLTVNFKNLTDEGARGLALWIVSSPETAHMIYWMSKAEPEGERMRLDKDSVTEIGAFLLAARQKAGKSLLDIELDTGMAKQTVSQVENGKTMPRLATLAALADEYGFEIEIREKGA